MVKLNIKGIVPCNEFNPINDSRQNPILNVAYLVCMFFNCRGAFSIKSNSKDKNLTAITQRIYVPIKISKELDAGIIPESFDIGLAFG
jgi:hypothetical protein